MTNTGLLLDTHVALWMLEAPKRLGKKARSAIESAEMLQVSSISLAEVVLKQMSGKLERLSGFQTALIESGADIVSFDSSAALYVARFGSLAKHDPFDRLILGHASALNSRFLTADSVLLGAGLIFVMDAEQ